MISGGHEKAPRRLRVGALVLASKAYLSLEFFGVFCPLPDIAGGAKALQVFWPVTTASGQRHYVVDMITTG